MSMQDAVMLDAQQAYALWASGYDATPNPLLALEERALSAKIDSLCGGDVIELGCGTGRWLKRLSSLGARSLTGVDFSRPMLAEAEEKCGRSARLIHADCAATPLLSRSADFILASFLLSYVRDLGQFAREAARLLRLGGRLVVSDLHPDTRSYGWRRTFASERGVLEIETFAYTLSVLVDAMNDAGLRMDTISECCFGEEEAEIFRTAGKLENFYQVKSLPVIYWAQFSLVEQGS